MKNFKNLKEEINKDYYGKILRRGSVFIDNFS
jgi:hypothetical protein